MEKDIFQKLIKKYINGECTPEEIVTVHKWYDSFDEDQNPVDILSSEQQQQLKQRLLSGIKTNLETLDAGIKPSAQRRVSNTLIYSLITIAAVFVMVVGMTFFESGKTQKGHITASVTVVNNTKSIQKVELKDGSVVWLNPNSKIEYPENFAAEQRTVKMKGEAFFEVSPDKKRPFLIYSDNVITRVLGTSFRIRAFESIPVEVSVVTGKVSVRLQRQNDSEVMLLPNQKATYLKSVNVLKKESERKASAIRIWKKATLSFDNEPIKEVVKALNVKFGVHIISTDEKLLSYVLKADFTDQSLPSILEMLKKSLELEYEINDREILLKTK